SAKTVVPGPPGLAFLVVWNRGRQWFSGGAGFAAAENVGATPAGFVAADSRCPVRISVYRDECDRAAGASSGAAIALADSGNWRGTALACCHGKESPLAE